MDRTARVRATGTVLSGLDVAVLVTLRTLEWVVPSAWHTPDDLREYGEGSPVTPVSGRRAR